MSRDIVRSRSRSQVRLGQITPSVFVRKSCCPQPKKRRRRRCRRKRRRRSGCRKKRRKRSCRRRRRRRSGCRKKRRRRRCRRKRRRRRRSCSRRRKCGTGAPNSKNPFLNFLGVYRRKHCGWPAGKIALEGAKCWCKMKAGERKKYIDQARQSRRGSQRRSTSRPRSLRQA